MVRFCPKFTQSFNLKKEIFYSILFYSAILFYSILFSYSILFYSFQFYFISIQFFSFNKI